MVHARTQLVRHWADRVFLTVAFAAQLASAGSFQADGVVDVVARRLQSRLPACAADGLIEARRDNRESHYSILLKFDKTWVIKVRVHLDQAGATKTTAEVEAVMIKGGLLFDTEQTLPAETEEWTERVKSLSADAAGSGDCPHSSNARGGTSMSGPSEAKVDRVERKTESQESLRTLISVRCAGAVPSQWTT